MTTTLITGANKGLGFETARRLVDAGHTVYVASRDGERGTRAAQRLGARAVQLDVTDDAKAFPNMRINAVEPGFTKTDLNGNTGVQTVEEGAEIIVRMAQIGTDGPTGGYFGAEGAFPW